MITTALWSFAVFLASVFGACIAAITLRPKYKKAVMIPAWIATALIGYGVAYFAYSVNLYDDLVGILGLSAIVCLAVYLLYEGTWSSKLFVALTACLIDNVATFMFCGTTDTLLAGQLGLIQESPYDTPNLLFFIGIKLVVYTVFFFLYAKFLRRHLQDMIETLSGKMASFVAAPAVSVVGFYVINMFTNSHGIFPNEGWFFPLYLTICLIFVVEFWLIFYSVLWSSRAMKNAAELNVAANIQKSMLPSIFPAFPDRAEFDIYATMDPAKEVGGDFYDFFMVDDTHLAVVVADVSGKGVPAALFMVIGKTLIKDHTKPGLNLGEVFSEVNQILCVSNSEGLFITAFEAVLDLETGECRYVNAGHETPYILRKGEAYEPHKIRPGFVLAGMEEIKYREASVTLNPGDKVFLYTDGVTEATDANTQLYGKERLEAALNRLVALEPTALLPEMKADIDRFVGSAPQFDDITMLSLEYKGPLKGDTK